MKLLVDSRQLWAAATNCYVVAPEPGGPAVIVDAPPDTDGIGDLLASHDLTPVALLVTHGHVDHAGGAGSIVRAAQIDAGLRAGLRAYVHPDDDFLTLHPARQIELMFGVGVSSEDRAALAPPARFEPLADGAVLDLAGIQIEVLHTPGHTPGHCCFLVRREGLLFSGDQLFAGSIGRTDLPGGDHGALMRSMADKVLVLRDDTDVLPGHGPVTTLARERLVNPFLQELLRP
ncbi:MAG TPA: MBL fold metallo-hydrolase [Acidimicrobiia bacterium]